MQIEALERRLRFALIVPTIGLASVFLLYWGAIAIGVPVGPHSSLVGLFLFALVMFAPVFVFMEVIGVPVALIVAMRNASVRTSRNAWALFFGIITLAVSLTLIGLR